MSDRRSWRINVAASILLVVGLLAALAVCSHDPADLAEGVYPLHHTPHNLLGFPGALAARSLVDGLGTAVYVFLAAWLALAAPLFLRQGWRTSVLHLLGWSLLTPTAAVLADRFGAPWPGGPPAGQGGALSAWLSLWLAAHFHPGAQFAVLGICLLIGLAFSADFITRRLPRLVRWAGVKGFQSLWEVVGLPERRPTIRSFKKAVQIGDHSPDAVVKPTPEATNRTHTIPIIHHHVAAPSEGIGKTAAIIGPTDHERFADYKLPPLKLLEEAKPLDLGNQDQVLRDRAALLEKTFTDFGLNVRVVGINTGPVVTQFELALETGLRLHKVTALADDVALSLRASSVHGGPDPRQKHRRRGDSQRTAPRRSAEGSDPRFGEEDRQKQDSAVPRQGRGRPAARSRLGGNAAPAHRRRDRHRQVGMYERDYPQHVDDAAGPMN